MEQTVVIPDIQKAVILDIRQIARHTYHLKIQSEDFRQMAYIPGFTLNMYLGDPFTEPEVADRKYSFWNYDSENQIADIAICTFSKGKGAAWIQTLQPGDMVYFKPPRGKLLVDTSADKYLLIGDITALSHLYEIYRYLPADKDIFSFIYVKAAADIFPDIDGRLPFSYHIINPVSAKAITRQVILHLPEDIDRAMAYILGDPDTSVMLHNYFKKERAFPAQSLKTKPFWKTEK